MDLWLASELRVPEINYTARVFFCCFFLRCACVNESAVMSRRGKQVNWPHDQHQFAGTGNFYTDINKEGRMQLRGAQYGGHV